MNNLKDKLKTKKKVFDRFGYDLAVDSLGKGSAKGSKGLKGYYNLQKSQGKPDRHISRDKQILRKTPLDELGLTSLDIPIVFDDKLFPKSAPGFNKKNRIVQDAVCSVWYSNINSYQT